MRSAPVLALLTCSLLVGSAFPQQTHKTQHPKKTVPSSSRKRDAAQNYLTSAFDPSVERLTPHFEGNSLEAVYKALNSSFPKKKSEYETTAEYREKRASFANRQLLGGLTPTSTMAFVLSEGDEISALMGFGFKTTYNADSQVLTATISARRSKLYLAESQPEVLEVDAISHERDSDTYIGSNAFGASVEVSRYSYSDYGFALEPDTWPFETEESYRQEASFKLNLSPSSAQQLKKDLRMVLIGRLRDPWAEEDVSGHEPTIDAPSDTTHSKHLLVFVPEQIWAVNYASGEVLRKFAPEGPQRKLVLQVAIPFGTAGVQKDDGTEKLEMIEGTKVFRARDHITVTLTDETTFKAVRFTLNDQPVVPNWKVNRGGTGDYSYFESAVATFRSPVVPSASAQDSAEPSVSVGTSPHD